MEEETEASEYRATYSPDDNKLRLYAEDRLSAELYANVKANGFKWAPKQKLFVAPMWTPSRESFLIRLCGEIGDEDQSLVERQAERAERFEDYSEKRAEDATRAREHVEAITDGIPLGQPILVGHHSEKRARRDAEKIERGMRRAVNLWEQSEYWTRRAEGALHHAKYKELPGVRARRIKGLEADRRKRERQIKEAAFCLSFWSGELKRKESAGGGFIPVDLKHATWFSNLYDHSSRCYSISEFPRVEGASTYEGMMGLWSALGCGGEKPGIITPEQARDLVVPRHQGSIRYCQRWIDHIDNRLAYEKAMLNEQGASALLEPKKRPTLLPLLNYREEVIGARNRFHRGEFEELEQVEMTSAEFADIYTEYKGTSIAADGSHRVRIVCAHRIPGRSKDYGKFAAVFLTDSKEHPRPKPTIKLEAERWSATIKTLR